MNKSLPGFDSPAVGFEQPFEMLEACHDRVRRSLALLTRLIEHVDAQGHDAQSRSAAADVQRYFDLAAPLHHQDEELHVFPVLRGGGDAVLMADIELLERDHERMEGLWSHLRLALVRWRAPGDIDPIDHGERAAARDFVAIYSSHLIVEEGRVFPSAKALLDAAALRRMGEEMQQRRRRPL